jgi:hypothetical protein
MPYEIDWEPSGVCFRFSGVVSDGDLVSSNEEVYASPLFSAMRYQIADFGTIDGFEASSETVRSVADSDRRAAEINPDVKVAIITSTPFMRGMSNMYALSHEAPGESWIVELFEGEENARAWVVRSG